MAGDDPKRQDEDPAPASRPTTRPQYDPTAIEEQSQVRERAVTITDEVALEQARVASLPSDAPAARKSFPDSSVTIGRLSEPDLSPEDRIAIVRDRLSPLTRVPHLVKKIDELGAEVQDPKTAYVLGFIDGLLPLETIIEVTGLPELDTLEVLDRMVEAGHVVFKKL